MGYDSEEKGERERGGGDESKFCNALRMNTRGRKGRRRSMVTGSICIGVYSGSLNTTVPFGNSGGIRSILMSLGRSSPS